MTSDDRTGIESGLRFDGRVAVVTGAGRGIGREFAHLLAARGAAVVVNDIGRSADSERYGTEENRQPAETVAQEIRDRGGRAVASTADISSEGEAASIVALAREMFGGVDIVVNNAGIVIMKEIRELSVSDFLSAFNVHVIGAFNVLRAAWAHMCSQRYGRVVNVTSSEGCIFGSPGMAAYAAAKGGSAGLTRVLATEGQPFGIQVNGVLPGAVTRAQRSTDESRSPSHEIDMSPSLVAPGVVWLAHEQCAVSGKFFATSSGRMGAVYTGVAEGYQAPDLKEWTLEAARDNWQQIAASEPAIIAENARDYKDFRIAAFRKHVKSVPETIA